MKNMEKGIN